MLLIFVFVILLAFFMGGVWFYFYEKYAHNEDSTYQRSSIPVYICGSSLFAAVAVFLMSSIYIIQPGTVAYTKLFGTLNYKVMSAGLYIKNPFSVLIEENVKRRSIDYTGDRVVESLTLDKVTLLVDVTIPWAINGHMAPYMYEKYGASEDWNLLVPASRDAVRSCVSSLNWEKAVSAEGRETVAECVPKHMARTIIRELTRSGLSLDEAGRTFIFHEAIVRNMRVKHQRILTEIAEEVAAGVELRRQKILTEKAKLEALRRETEGEGIEKMMSKLPKGYTVDEMATLIRATADKITAETFEKSVQAGNPKITVIIGSSVPASVKAN